MYEKTKDRRNTSKDTSGSTSGTESQDATGSTKYPSPMLAAALELAAAGLKVFPLSPKSKKPPRGSRGHKDGTTNPRTIRRWWKKTPTANIGISCRDSGIVVIDIDPRHGGLETLEKLKMQLGALPITVMAKTGGRDGGFHLFFRHPGFPLVGNLGPGVDVKSNGYVVVAPSEHPDGGLYAWAHSPFETPIAELPVEWALALIKNEPNGKPTGKSAEKGRAATTTAYGRAAIERERKAVEQASQGARNEILNKAAYALGQLHAGREIAEDVRETLVQAAITAGLPEAEARSTVESGWTAGMAEPRSAPEEVEAERASMAARLVKIAEDELEILCDERGDAYAFIEGVDGNQLLPVRGGAFKGFLAETEFNRSGQVPGSETIRAALTIIEARARRGRRVTLANRVARGENGAIWLDMADKTGRAIRVTGDGWEIVDRPPPLFRRYAHQQPLPIPVHGGNAMKILDFVNLPDPKDRMLYVVSTAVALVPHIPQPIMIFVGPQGSAKTTAAKIRRCIIDPSATPTIITKSDPDEVVLALDQHYLPILDNVTRIPGWLSDILCQAVTGGSFTKRQLYSDLDLVLLSFRRPITITAINLPQTPPDLPDRALVLNFEPPTKRLREDELWPKFEAELPAILGGMLDMLAHAMLCQDMYVIPELPRMADFGQWGAGAADALPGGMKLFLEALADNSAQRDITVTDDDIVGAAIKTFAESLESPWIGSPTELLTKLSAMSGVATQSRAWPRQAAGLSRRLTALQAVLASQGIMISWHKTGGNRYWRVLPRRQ